MTTPARLPPAATGDSGQAAHRCYHCNLPLQNQRPYSAAVAGAPREFCCPGCLAVCTAIHEAGLGGFYARTPDGAALAPPPPPSQDWALYDLDEMKREFVTERGDVREITLLVEGIHCAACVWLIERALAQVPGVTDARVNLTGKRLHLGWEPKRVKLSDTLRRLAAVGYAAIPYDPEVAEGRLKARSRAQLYRIAFAGFTAMNLMWISIALYTGADRGEYRTLFQWVGFALATPTLLYAGWPFFQGAWAGLRRGFPTMDLPIALGATATYVYSVYVTLTHAGSGSVYYDTVVNFVFIILVGRYLEAASRRHAVASIQRLLDLQPRGATVLRDGREAVVPIRTVRAGDLVLIKPGTTVPVDGTVLEGCSEADEAMLTGEVRPVAKRPGAAVAAGSTNLGGALTVRVDATLKDTALGRIIKLVEDAQAAKAPIQCLTDRIVPWFVGATLGLAAVTFAWWLGTGIENALLTATAVLIVTCPCAFGLATPMSIAVASGLGARHGILVKNGAVLETLSHVTHVVFDKTGTLTEGRMQVREVHAAPFIDRDRLLKLAAAVERYSEHSIARAIVAAASGRDAPTSVQDFRYAPGQGVAARVDGTDVMLGTETWLQHNGVAVDPSLSRAAHRLQQEAVSCVHVSVEGRSAGLIGIADRLRADAPALVDGLRAAGIAVSLLSGDRRAVADAVAAQLGGMDVIAEVLPQDKHRVIGELQQKGAVVAMIGDGVNDAPALARADVGIALGSGTDVSAESADLVLISDELDKVRAAILLSRRTLRTVRQNIGLSIAYNVVMVPLAMAGLVTPLIAAIAMPVSSLLVIGNAARIGRLFAAPRAAGPAAGAHAYDLQEAR